MLDDGSGAGGVLLCRLKSRLFGIPLRWVAEVMRPLPLQPVADAPGFVSGLAVVRGATVPIVDVGRLLGTLDGSTGRWVSVVAGGRAVALAVEGVIGVRSLPPGTLQDFPPLLAGSSAARAAVGVLDGELLQVLTDARLIPERLERTLDAEARP